MHARLRRSLAIRCGLFGAVLAPPALAQSFVRNTADIPTGPSQNNDSENVDFGDVDLDGDWDAAFADGGDSGNDQNRLWINQGGLQGGVVGVFLDETTARFPAIMDSSRDVEFADIDADADLDLYVANHSQVVNQTSRFWVNLGGDQGGLLGYYQDETSTRWVNLGGPGSSITGSLILPGGGFVDWSGDGDFADLDNDGDLDLVHSSYGGAYSAGVPTRIFLNDANGFFEEFNPSGFTPPGSTLLDGHPGLWCDGTQMNGTTDTTGTFCDIVAAVVDFALGDNNNDLDIDILLGERDDTLPRFFLNRLEETGSFGFIDISGGVFGGPSFSTGGGTFDQELGDLDGDDDLDLYGLNWGFSAFSFDDITMENLGGVWGNPTTLPGSGADDEEGDFFDYDNDGDLDLYVANFSGLDRLYRNTNDGGATFAFVDVSATELPGGLGDVTRDVDAADVDNDGDYDLFVAVAKFKNDYYLENVTQVPDHTAPRVPLVETVGVAAAMDGALPTRAQVYDNAAYYTTWYADTAIELTVNGIALPDRPMASSGAQIFRGEIPANLVGLIDYRVRSTDEHGNAGSSATQSYAATGATGVHYGAETSAGLGPPTIQTLSEARGGELLFLAGSSPYPGSLAVFGISLADQVPPILVPSLPNVLANIDPNQIVFTALGPMDASGDLVVEIAVPPTAAGLVVYAQFIAKATGGPLTSSMGLELSIL